MGIKHITLDCCLLMAQIIALWITVPVLYYLEVVLYLVTLSRGEIMLAACLICTGQSVEKVLYFDKSIYIY